MPRPFASGSRQAPDPYDQYLEKNGFYRKHTARDSSCLFRTISEQMYGSQMHHLEIRRRCVDYMRKHKHFFQKSIDRDIDEYLDEMSKPKTFGSKTELRAMAHMYRRNVILFQAYDTGNRFTNQSDFKSVFRIFFTPDRHFDSVFISDYIGSAAFCQGMVYEILYKTVFKLPDVMYAVEEMLHRHSLEFVKCNFHYSGPYATKVVYADNRSFDLDLPEETNCILDNHVLCHFHNPSFPQFADTLHRDMQLIEFTQFDNQKITRTLDSLLPDKYMSCVRQLLKDGITPFPYKVAKALDPDIYRNIEFDSWSEERKEQRLKNWYMGGSNLQIGVKCLVRLGSESNVFSCYIQEMFQEIGDKCLVYVEELAEKYTVPFESLQPLPSDQAKPWPLPYRFQRNLQKNMIDYKKNRTIITNGKKSRDLFTPIKKELYTEEEIPPEKDDVSYQLKSFTSIEHYCPPPYQVLAMPFNVDHNGNSNEPIHHSRRNSANSAMSRLTGPNDVKTEPKQEDTTELDFPPTDNFTQFSYETMPEHYYPYAYDGGVVHPGGPHNPFYCMYNSQPAGPIVPHGVYIQPTAPCSQSGANPFYPAQSGTVPSVPIFPTPTAVPPNTMSNVNICRQHNGAFPAANGRINFSVNRSVLPSGDDLPHDVATLQYFYNLGYECYKQNQKRNDDKNDPINKLSNDLQMNLKLEKDTIGGNSKSDHNSGVVHNNGKKYSSRYFNSKKNDKSTYRSNGNGGGHSERFANSETHGKSVNHGKRTSSSGSTLTSQTCKSTMSSLNSIKHCAEQAIQTSPASTSITTETWTNDLINNNIPIYNAQAGPMPFNGPCIPVYPEGDPPVYVQTPTIVTMPYGMYPVPQTAHPTHNFPAYVPPTNPPPIISAPPPAYASNPFTSPGGGNESAPIVLNPDNVDPNNPFTFMGYPPMYFPTNAGGLTPNAAPVQTGYWYPVTPPFPSNMTPTQVANNCTTSTSSAISIPSR